MHVALHAPIVIMGVSASGKSLVGLTLAQRLGWRFIEGDDFHPPANIAKMASGLPLDDVDRAPWLSALNAHMRSQLAEGQAMILSCSTLKASYRRDLAEGLEAIRFVYLNVSRAVLEQRLQDRAGHFMPSELLDSQFADLQEPGAGEAFWVAGDLPVMIIVQRVIEHFKDLQSP
jgi:carbohydrate kinase (thermoresistant glucokinase family)